MSAGDTPWRETTLGELLSIKHGFAFLGEYFGDSGSHVVLTPGNFNEEGGFVDRREKSKWYRGPIPAEYVLDADSLLVAMTEQAEGLLGSSALVPRSSLYLHNQRLGLVQVRDPCRADTRFLYYLFNHRPVRQQIRASASGTKIRHTSPTRIEAVVVPVPGVEQQRRIASTLTAYDDLIENCQRRIRILEDMARGLYREWFVRFRFPGADSLSRVDSPLGPIPQGWLGRFAELATIARGTINPAGQSDEEFVHFSLPAFDDGQRAVVESGASILSNKTLVPVPCTLLSKLNPRIPRVWRVSTATVRRAIASTEFLALVANDANTSDFVHATCTSKLFQDRLAALAIGTSTSHQRVKPDSLLDMAVVVPTLAVRRRFAESIRPNLDLAEVLRSKIANLRRTRDLLLPRLMSGQIDLSALAPTDDSAIPAPAPSLV